MAGIDLDNAAKILGYGISGLAFLLAVLAFWLLQSEQKKKDPSPAILKAIYVFEAFAICLALFGLINEVSRSSRDQQTASLKQQLDNVTKDLKAEQTTNLTLSSELKEYQQLKPNALTTEKTFRTLKVKTKH
jgi:hypothetical protein